MGQSRFKARGIIWWIWSAFDPPKVHIFDVENAWRLGEPDPDVYWLGECAWTARHDNTATGLTTA